jgi:endonuclease/exonuclease/phosphatase family metal-dependent hydrolase
MVNKGQVKRAKAIAMVLSDVNYDVIIIQEAFHRRGRGILSRTLSKHYPHQHGPGKGGLIKINSGVWILSRFPLTNRKSIKFSNCKCLFQDCRANKGALFVELEKNGQKIQLIATHVQAEKGAQFDAIRSAQFLEIKENYVSPQRDINIPQIIAGDLNTLQIPNSKPYDDMIDLLEAQDPHLMGEFKFTYGGKPNDLIGKEVVEGKVIDYVLFNPKKSPVVHEYNRVKIFRKKWKKNKIDLSDHYALEANFIISNEK